MLCWPRTLLMLSVVALGVLSMLSACGQKGDLYLPEKPAETPSPRGADVPFAPTQPRDAAKRATQPSS